LDGDDFDFQTLVEIFGTNGDPAVHRPEPGRCYFVDVTTIGAPPDPPNQEAARVIVQRINGVVRTLDVGFRPVTLSGRYSSTEGATAVVLAGASAEIRSRVTAQMVVNGEPAPSPLPKGPKYLALAASLNDVADALRVLGQPGNQLDWNDLFKVFEIVQHAAGGTDAIEAASSKTEIAKFTASANHPGLSGNAARHARQKGSPRRTGMSLAEAHHLVTRLVVAWIESAPGF
jgi:hypothetical protein